MSEIVENPLQVPSQTDDGMNKHVCSLELSKQLYEAKIVTDAEHWWYLVDFEIGYVLEPKSYSVPNIPRLYPAPIAEELLELMPENIEVNKVSSLKTFRDKKLSNACAKMLLWLKSENYIS